MSTTEIKRGYGVIIARYETPEIHAGQKFVIDEVFKNHENIIFVLGVTAALPDNEDPMDFETRKLMVLHDYADATVLPLKDVEYDEDWSANLDNLISSSVSNKTVTLYGSRDSFIKYYSGRFKTHELVSPNVELSATTLRIMASQKALSTVDFRKGVIYGVASIPPHPYAALDIAIVNGDEVLVCMKPWQKKPRFFGGFLDNTDKNKKSGAIREAIEETKGTVNLNITTIQYIDEFKIEKDWRYRNRVSKVFSDLFYIEGKEAEGMIAQGGDDLEKGKVMWLKISQLHSIEFVPEHEELKEAFITFMINKLNDDKVVR